LKEESGKHNLIITIKINKSSPKREKISYTVYERGKRKPNQCNICRVVEKLLATNWSYLRCKQCGTIYASLPINSNVKIIDKTNLGNIEERTKKGLPY
jgi:hypothetical protein